MDRNLKKHVQSRMLVVNRLSTQNFEMAIEKDTFAELRDDKQFVDLRQCAYQIISVIFLSDGIRVYGIWMHDLEELRVLFSVLRK